MDSNKDWFFSNKSEEDKRAALKKQAQDELKAHLENSSSASGKFHGRRKVVWDEQQQESASDRRKTENTNFNQSSNISTKGNDNHSRYTPLLPALESSSNITTRAEGYERQQFSNNRAQTEQMSSLDEDDKYFIRRLKVAFDNQQIPFGFGFAAASQPPSMIPYQQYIPQPRNTQYLNSYSSTLPPSFSNQHQSNNYQQAYYPSTALHYQPSQEPRYFPNESDPVSSRSGKDTPPQQQQQTQFFESQSKPTATANDTSEKRFHRGISDVTRIPDWQREDMEKKQRKLLENQRLLKEQMEERDRHKRMEKEREDKIEREEQERIEKEQQELENRYKNEISQEKDKAAKKSKDDNKPTNISNNVDNATRELAKDTAAQKMLEAQKEAEELRKQKFMSKRMAATVSNADSKDGNSFPAHVEQEDFQIRGNITQSSDLETTFTPTRNPFNENQISQHNTASIPRDLISQLEKLKMDLEKERIQFHESLIQSRSGRYPEQDDYHPRQISTFNSVLPKKKIDFVMKEDVRNVKQQLHSTSTYVPVNAKIAEMTNTALLNRSPRRRKESYSTIDYDVNERLAEARQKRFEID